MSKNRIWLGIILSIILLVFSVNGFATDYTYTQESGAGFFVGSPDKSDAQEDTNEIRQIVNDLGALLVHSKMDGLYPKDLTTGGTIQIPEAGLKFSNAPVNDDIAAYIAGEMAWQTKAELGLDLTLYYLKTEIDTLGEVETIYVKDIIDSDELAALKFTDLADTPANYTGASLKFARVNVGETALEFAAESDPTVDTDAEIKAILVDEVTKTGDFTAGRITKINNATGIIEQSDIEKKANGGYDVNANSIGFTEQVLASGAVIAWDLRIGNKATLMAAHAFTITITAPTEALNAQLIITQDGTGTRVMDEIVTQSDVAIAEAEVHIDTEIIDLAVDIPTGARIRFKSTTTVPAPLVADTIYWAIRTSENHIQVATTKALAMVPTAVDLTDDGTGTHTVQQLVKWTGGTLGVLSTAAGSEDILSLTYKTADNQWYAQLAKDFK